MPRPDALPNPQEFDTCTSDADCIEMPHGYCGSGQGNAPGAYCSYGCVEDAECGDGSICVCGEPVGRCTPSSCVSDADCGADFRCQSFDSSHGCGAIQFACQTPSDTCASDADCLASAAGQYCDATSGSFACVPGGCAIGRPFLVEGCERVAPLVERADWLELELPLDVVGVPHELCLRAAEGWARVGQMEHASVAAFARFALQLLQLGAPPQLVEAATSAMSDETRHAKLAFGVASRYARKPLGPGQLDIERSLGEASLLEVVRLVMREGCIGETAAALEAREIAEHVTEPSLRASIARVAEDETRHAELAWRFVRWALEQEPVEVAEVVRAELLRAEREPVLAGREPTREELALLGLGILPEGLRGELRRAALREVILPCGAALLVQALPALPQAHGLSA